jgi:hypothetical protein
VGAEWYAVVNEKIICNINEGDEFNLHPNVQRCTVDGVHRRLLVGFVDCMF